MFRIPFFTTIVIDFRIRTTWTFADFPEIIHTRNHVLFRNTAFHPEIMGFMVIRIISNIKLMWIQSIVFVTGEKLICPRNDLVSKIIPNGEVSHHFKECVVPSCMSDIIDIISTNALLCIGDSTVLWSKSSIKIFF